MDGRRRVDYDLDLQISPYAVYRRITDDEELELVDLRGETDGRGQAPPLQQPVERPASLKLAAGPPDIDWVPPSGVDVVLFDQDGKEALERVRLLRRQGHQRVWALFGGLELWDLALGQ